jgi:hypothetical protein
MENRTSISATNAVKRELVITRVFDAPRELVWKAWRRVSESMTQGEDPLRYTVQG